jgi:uncharacterized membrane protein
MYNSGYFAATDIEDAKIVSQTYRSPILAYDKDLISKIKKLRSGGYGKSLLQKNSYVVRGALVGGVILVGFGMFFKKNIWGMAIIGLASGSVAGHFVGNFIENKKQDKKTNTITDGKQL